MVTASQFYHLLPFSAFWLLWHGSAEHEVSRSQLISPSKIFSPSGVMSCLGDFNYKQHLPSWNSFLHIPDPVFSWTSSLFFQSPCAFPSSGGQGGALELDFLGSHPSSSTSYLCSVGQVIGSCWTLVSLSDKQKWARELPFWVVWEFNGMMNVKHFAGCLACNKCCISCQDFYLFPLISDIFSSISCTYTSFLELSLCLPAFCSHHCPSLEGSPLNFIYWNPSPSLRPT